VPATGVPTNQILASSLAGADETEQNRTERTEYTMARISRQFANEFLKTDDIEECPDRRSPPLTIWAVSEDEVGNQEKLVVSFRGTSKKMTLNKTNALALAESLGDETNDWKGAVIVLGVDKTMFQGKRVPCIRIAEAYPPGEAAAAAAATHTGPLPF
jgi:hypothetical protein